MKLCLAPLGVAATGWVVGCGDASQNADEREDPYQLQTAPNSGIASPSTTWAVGGTKAMRGGYPDPFVANGMGAACSLYPAMTIGPCYSQGPAAREDISDGLTGVPLRISLLVVRGSTCSAVPNAVVDIWHTGSNGVYSAFASGTCNPDKLPVANQRFCRGTQTTDANGRVNFSTVFPGWYPGRSIHIHFTVRAANQTFTSQLFFEDVLDDEIMTTTEYKARGTRKTTNKTDMILRNVNLSQVLFSTAKRSDGALHAWKVLTLRA